MCAGRSVIRARLGCEPLPKGGGLRTERPCRGGGLVAPEGGEFNKGETMSYSIQVGRPARPPVRELTASPAITTDLMQLGVGRAQVANERLLLLQPLRTIAAWSWLRALWRSWLKESWP